MFEAADELAVVTICDVIGFAFSFGLMHDTLIRTPPHYHTRIKYINGGITAFVPFPLS